jgi:hypothetical protein
MIVNGKGVSEVNRQAAVLNVESRFNGIIDKCQYIAVLNGWNKW